MRGADLGLIGGARTDEAESDFQRRGRTDERPEIRFALAIPHTPWKPERVESVRRLVDTLDAGGGCRSLDDSPGGSERFKLFTDRERPHVWAEKLLRWALTTTATHLIQLQDDVVPAPNFWNAAFALVEAYPDQLLGLETAHPVAPALCQDSTETVRIITTSDGLIGVGWIMPLDLVREFLEWRQTQLLPGGVEAITEDTLMGVWCLATGRRVYHPIPTIIDHDVTLESTYGNDGHANRRPTVRWDQAAQFGDQWDARELEAPNFWRGGRKKIRHYAPDGATLLGMRTAYNADPAGAAAAVRHVGRFYSVTPTLARTWVKGFDAKAYRRAMADDGQRQLRNIAILRRARRDEVARERVLVCTPTRGGIAPQFAAGLTALVRLFEIDLDNGLELLESWQWQEDVVRVRSRFLRAALETDATVVHFRDSDIATGGMVVLGMLATGKDFVCAPYPARDGIPWDFIAKAIAAGDTRSLEALSYQYKVGPLPERTGDYDETGCTPVEWMPLGCSVIRRRAIEHMLEFYDAIGADEANLEAMRSTRGAGHSVLVRRIEALCAELEQWRRGHRGLHYEDQVNGVDHPTIGLFQLINRRSAATKKNRLYGEDQSFCLRALDAGVQPYMYLGVGSPVGHVGELLYRGALESFGLTRTPQPTKQAPPTPAADPDTFALDTPEDPRSEPVEPAGP